MNVFDTARGSGAVGLIAGAMWSVLSIASLVTPDPEWYLDLLVLVPFSLTLVAILGLDRIQRACTGVLGRIGFWMSAISMIVALTGQAALVIGLDELVWLSFPVGALGWLIGFALYGIATARAGVVPRWVGWAIALSQPLTMLLGVAFSPISSLAEHGDFSGALAHGLVWLAIGWTLRTSDVRANVPSAARGVTHSSLSLQGADGLH